GNRHLSVRIDSPGGGGFLSGRWQRHATLFVYVPACKAIAVRGGLVGLEIDGIDASVVLTRSGEHDRDYDGKFRVANIRGSLTVQDSPLDEISNINGN